MTELKIVMYNGDIFPMITPIFLTGKDLVRRVRQRADWSYIFVCSCKNDIFFTVDPNDLDEETNHMDTFIPNGSTVKIMKKIVDPILHYYNIENIISSIKRENEKEEYVNHILIWLDYNIFYNKSEPMYLYLIYKSEGEWKEDTKTGTMIDMVDIFVNKIYQGVFHICDYVRDRFEELYYTYGPRVSLDYY